MNNNSYNLHSLKFNREIIFIESLKELINRKKQKDPYSFIRKGAILRFLIVDKGGFVNNINQSYNIPTTFKLRKIGSIALENCLEEKIHSSYSLIYYKYYLDSTGEKINIAKFLELPIFKIQHPQLTTYLKEKHISDKYNIRELIQLIANAHGGVHIEKWKNISADLMIDDLSPFNINANSEFHKAIDSVIDIIIEVLTPLANEVYLSVKKTKPIAYEIRADAVLVKDEDELQKIKNENRTKDV